MKTSLYFLVLAFFVGAAFGQTGDENYQKKEFYGGFSNLIGERTVSGGAVRNYPGFEFSAVGNFNRYFGLKGGFSAGFGNRTSTGTVSANGVSSSATFRSSNQIYNFLGGVQVKDNRTSSRFKPFAHALAGVGYGRFKTKVENCSVSVFCSNPAVRASNAGFAVAVGGGLDIRVSDKIDIRAVQVDYNPIRFDDRFIHNARIGFGIVFH